MNLKFLCFRDSAAVKDLELIQFANDIFKFSTLGFASQYSIIRTIPHEKYKAAQNILAKTKIVIYVSTQNCCNVYFLNCLNIV